MKPTTTGIIEKSKPKPKKIIPEGVTQVTGDGVWLWGRLCDFERDGYFSKPTEHFMRS